MKFLPVLYCALAVIFLQSCGSHNEKNTDDKGAQSAASSAQTPVPKANSNLVVKNKEDLVGYWVGTIKADTFNNEMTDYEYIINIAIDAIDGDQFKGHTVMAGIVTPIAGSIKKDNETFSFIAHQQGSGKLDGIFNASIPFGDTTMNGAWTPDKVVNGVSGRLYSLNKKIFHYNPATQIANDASFVGAEKEPHKKLSDDEAAEFASTTDEVTKYNPSEQLLTKEDIANCKKSDLLILRNSIFARHGYAFKKASLRSYFENQKWYIPLSSDVTHQLTDVEKKNIEMLNRYEKNAEEYYRSFSR